jgi:hypothetical protein
MGNTITVVSHFTNLRDFYFSADAIYGTIYYMVLRFRKESHMEILSMQMVAEIAAGLDPIITDFVTNYVTNHAAESKFDPARYEYKQLVHTALSNALSKANDAQSNPLSKAFKAENKYRKGKKERWYASAVKNVSDNDFTSSKHIFSSTIMIYQNSSVKQKEILFGGKSLTDVVNDLLAETQAWSTDTASWLISFPGIQSFSVEKIYDSIISDVFINAFHFIKDHYNGDIRNFKQILPDTMVSFPFFGVKREPLDLKPANNMLVEKLLLADNSIFQTAVTLSNGNTGMIDEPRVQASLDQLDLAFFQYGMFANIDDEFYNSKSVTVPLLNFAKIINERPNKQYLNRAVERLRNYPHKVYSYIDKEHNIVMDEYNLIDRVQIINPSDYVPTDDYPYASDAKVIIYFGDRLYQEIVNEQLTIISRSSAELVSPGLPRLLCPVLQRERTILTLGLDRSKEIDPQMTQTYRYSFFARSVRTLGVRKSAKNIELLSQALREFHDTQLFIKAIAFHGDAFKITYFPLTDDERADIDFRNNRSTPEITTDEPFDESNAKE